jgi:NADPH:quinone reductase-like Zn-dependent oxidoreductase
MGWNMVKAFGYRSNGTADVQEFLELDTPSPLAGELLVQVRAAGVNPVDWKIRSGAYGTTPPDKLPTVFGFEASGVVRAVGQDVEGFAIGDEVFGRAAPGGGTWAEFALLTADGTAHKPPHVSFNDAATLPIAGATAYDGVTQLELKPGQTLLINGASAGVGVAAAQIARDLDINVIGIASEAKQALVESLDATFVAYGYGVADRVRALLPDGVDAIFDLAGGDGLRAVADLVTDKTKLISAADGATAAELGGHVIVREYTRTVLDLLAALVADGKLDPHVEDVVPLHKAADAMAAVEGGHAKGKVVIGFE